jgi:alpha-L-rhamnosidase
MFGGGLVWFYRNLAGMKSDEEAPGYKHIVFKPQPVAQVSQTAYMLQTSYGEAGIKWRLNNTAFEMDVTVPVGCTATVFVPTQQGQTAMVSDGANDEYVKQEGVEGGYTQFHVESGRYTFHSK